MDKVNKILAFDLTGPMAHFRKYFTNSSSLSYDFPPRTTVMGMIAGILGLERDSYYEDFGTKKCHIAVKIKEPTRSIQRTVNYLNTSKSKKGKEGLNGSSGHTQVPLEIILPKDIKENKLCFRIYFWHMDEKIMSELYFRLVKRSFVYPISLGLSEFLGDIENIQVYEDVKVKKSLDYVNISTVCNLDLIEDLGLDIIADNELKQYMKEIVPISFTANREDMLPGEFIYEGNGKSIRAKLKSHYLVIKNKGAKENIVFMEG